MGASVARTTIEDKAFVDARRMARIIKMPFHEVLGRLTAFWHDSQTAEVHQCSVDDIETWMNLESTDPFYDLNEVVCAMVEVGFLQAINNDNYLIRGNKKHIDNLAQRKEAARNGGLASGVTRQKSNAIKVNEASASTKVEASGSSETQRPVEPSTVQYSAVQKEEERDFEKKKTPTLSKEILESCCKTWIETLAHFKIQRPLNPSEQEQIGRAIQRWGSEFVDLSLYGARYEPSHEGFNPKDHVSLGRIFEKDKFGKHRIDKFVNWASQRKSKQQTMTGLAAQVEPDEPPADPEKVRAILAAAGFGAPRRGD